MRNIFIPLLLCTYGRISDGQINDKSRVPLIYYNGGSRHQENIIKWTTLQLSRIYRQQTTIISVDFLVCLRTRVRTDPGKVWKVLEFNVEIFKALKSLENDQVWKSLEYPWNCNADLENADVSYTVASVNFLALRDTKYLKFKVQKFESSSVFRIEEYTV